MVVFRPLLCLLLLLCSTINIANAYPTGAGHCLAGAVIGNASNGQHGNQGNGSLQAFQVRIGTDLILDSENPASLTAGESYSISLVTSDSQSAFRGFLFRLSGINGENVQDALVVTDTSQTKLLPSTGEEEGLAASCAPGVAGLTHISKDDKLSISAELMIDVTADVLLEVTVVTNNQGGAQNDWYYSSYELTVIADDGSPTTSTSSPAPTTLIDATTSPAPSVPGGGSTSSPVPTVLNVGATTSPAPSTLTSSPYPTGSFAPNPTGGTGSSTPSTSTSRPTMSRFPSAMPFYSPSSVTTEPSISGGSSPAPSLTTQQPSPEPDSAPLYECKWWCASIPTPWTSTEPDAYPKCDWTYSCSVCPECSNRRR